MIKLLESMGCEYVYGEQGGELITCQLPPRFDSENKRSVQVRMNDSLSCYIRNKADFGGGSIFDLVSYIHFGKKGEANINKNLPKSKEFICNVFGWKEFLSNRRGTIQVKDYTASLKEIIGSKRKRREYKPNTVINEDTMKQFYYKDNPLPYQDWIDEGITYDIQMKYGVGFDLESKRVVFPLRNRFGQLIGVKGRIMKDSDDPERKYLYLYRCNTSNEWFNYHNAVDEILKKKEVIIVESEKSCMKFASHGIWNTLAIGSSDITDVQVDFIKSLGLDIKICLGYDKDKTVSEVKEQADKFERRDVYGVVDMDNLLGEKDSPIDCGIDIWNTLYKNNMYMIKSSDDSDDDEEDED